MRVLLLAMMALLTLALAQATPVVAQSGPSLGNTQRECQTIRTCRFDRGGSYRGCLSSYTCRTCQLVRTRCEIGGRRQNCHEMRCTWGGSPVTG
jgi:hypothetical protein